MCEDGTRLAHLRGGGSGTATTRFLPAGAMMVSQDRRPDAHTLKLVVHELTGPNRMNVHHFNATARPSAGRPRLAPADQQRLTRVLSSMSTTR